MIFFFNTLEQIFVSVRTRQIWRGLVENERKTVGRSARFISSAAAGATVWSLLLLVKIESPVDNQRHVPIFQFPGTGYRKYIGVVYQRTWRLIAKNTNSWVHYINALSARWRSYYRQMLHCVLAVIQAKTRWNYSWSPQKNLHLCRREKNNIRTLIRYNDPAKLEVYYSTIITLDYLSILRDIRCFVFPTKKRSTNYYTITFFLFHGNTWFASL